MGSVIGGSVPPVSVPIDTLPYDTSSHNENSLKIPFLRIPREDISNPSLADLVQLATERVHHAICSSDSHDNRSHPYRLFPLAESTRNTFFAYGDWARFGDLETELGRLTWTLSSIPERGLPVSFQDIIAWLLKQDSVLAGWDAAVQQLQERALLLTAYIISQIQNTVGQRRSEERQAKEDFIAMPIDYETGEDGSKHSLALWRRSLAECAQLAEQGDLRYASQFLQIHAFLKDPIGGLSREFERHCVFFLLLLRQIGTVARSKLDMAAWCRVIAQAAQESSYLAIPQLGAVSFIHFHAHQQLSYVYTRLDGLARAEFTEAAHVLKIAEELITHAKQDPSLRIIPIIIAPYPDLPTSNSKDKGTKNPLTIIIDGNHRAVAIMFLRFLATLPDDYRNVGIRRSRRALGAYCQAYGLGPKWMTDLTDVLELLYSSAGGSSARIIAAEPSIVRMFSKVCEIAALVVQEENFHTICKQRVQREEGIHKEVWLLPAHQGIFNSKTLGFALPERRAQAHGRPLGFNRMPLLREYEQTRKERKLQIKVHVREIGLWTEA